MTFTELFITALLCAGYSLILILYQRIHAIDKKHRRIFNALVTGVALFLGINLQASLKSYVKMLRWNILAARYRPLDIFDLILGAESVTNVLKLYWRGRNKKWPMGLGVFGSKTSWLCLLWILVQLGIAVCVGIIGLTYNLDLSTAYVNTRTGNTSSINLDVLSQGAYLTELSSINTYLIKGDEIPPTVVDQFSYEAASTGYESDGQSRARYYFFDVNPSDESVNAESHRYMQSTASCQRYIVTQGEYGLSKVIAYQDSNGNLVNQTMFDTPGEGGLYVVSNLNSTCGERCTTVNLFQAAVAPEVADYYEYYIEQATWFSCDIHVSDVLGDGIYVDPIYQVPPMTSRMLAGALGLSANGLQDDKYMYHIYQAADEIGFTTVPTVPVVQYALTGWIMGAVEVMDDPSNGIESRLYVSNGEQPIQAQVLSVKWRYCATLLGIIPLVQLITWIVVVATANKVIVKDDSPLSMAKIYWTLLGDFLGHHGCLLDNDQLIEVMGNMNVVYGCKGGSGPESLKHVDVFEEGSECHPTHKFDEGDYDGPESLRKRKGRGRELDARDYF